VAAKKLIGRVAARTLVLLLAAAAVAVGVNTVSPHRIPWKEDWSRYPETSAARDGIRIADLAWMIRAVDQGRFTIFDARSLNDYRRGHLPGAMPFPFTEAEAYMQTYSPALIPSQPIVTYCAGRDCDEALLLCRYLKKEGFTNLILFAGGWAEWRRSRENRP